MSKESVLVIDDSSDMLALERIILEGDGYEVFTAQSGALAIEMLEKIQEPTVVILDQQMEDMSGTDFLDLLQTKYPDFSNNVPIIILSGGVPPSDSRAAGYIEKFPDIDVFLTKVRGFISNRTQH